MPTDLLTIEQSAPRRNRWEKHYNLFGLGIQDNKVDETLEQQKAYNEVAQEFPFQEGMSCQFLLTTMQQIQNKIDQKTQDVATGVTDRVGKRYISAYGQRKTDFENVYTKMNCDTLLASQEQQDYLDTQYNQLQRVQTLSSNTSKTATYLIFGIIGFAGLITLVVLFKKKSTAAPSNG